MPDSKASEPKAACVLWRSDWFSNCAGKALYEHNGKQYCVLHWPSNEKGPDFQKEVQRKFARRDYDFQSVWFPETMRFEKEFDFAVTFAVSCAGATFNGDLVSYPIKFPPITSFTNATFNGDVDFGRVTFQGAAFPDGCSFAGAKFNGRACFREAIFEGEASFSSATFAGRVDFEGATFKSKTSFAEANFEVAPHFKNTRFLEDATVDFTAANFGTAENKVSVGFNESSFLAKVDFTLTRFSDWVTFDCTFGGETIFDRTIFEGNAGFGNFKGDVFFNECDFHGDAYFSGGTFHEGISFSSVNFVSDLGLMEFRGRRFKNADLVSFDTMRLRPHWFVDVDARDFAFINVAWDWRDTTAELNSLYRSRAAFAGNSPPHDVLSIACQRLATNMENNNQYEDASKARYMAMDARRRSRWRGFPIWKLSWWYWLASGFGERIFRALVVLLAILFLFALLYTRVGFVSSEPKLTSEPGAAAAKRDDAGSPLPFRRALPYSAGVMMLQKPEPRPATSTAQFVTILQTILGPVQAALLALAIRRKFMR